MVMSLMYFTTLCIVISPYVSPLLYVMKLLMNTADIASRGSLEFDSECCTGAFKMIRDALAPPGSASLSVPPLQGENLFLLPDALIDCQCCQWGFYGCVCCVMYLSASST